MTADAQHISKQYRQALEKYLDQGGEDSLKKAYDLGRQALDSGIGILEMTALQHRTLSDLLAARHRGEESARSVLAAQDFFAESMSPFEMTHLGFRDANAALRRLNEHLNERLEEVTKQIATALHDEAWQLLSAICIDLDLAARDLPETSRVHLQNVRAAVSELEHNLRQLSHELRPKILDDLGILPALRFLADGVSKRAGIAITVVGPSIRRLHPAIESNLYRIVQEALVNLSRHAKASHARVVLRCDAGKVICQVQDDGVGFNLQEIMARKGYGGLGLLSIQERVATLGGSLQIDTAPERGTTVCVTIPLERAHGESRAANG